MLAEHEGRVAHYSRYISAKASLKAGSIGRKAGIRKTVTVAERRDAHDDPFRARFALLKP